MKKIALILHGWPRPDENSLLFKYFKNKFYKIVCPYLFSDNFEFSSFEIIKQVQTSLRGISPEVIVGISLGGLILPEVALNYPKTKLIFVASGVSANPKSILFRKLINVFSVSPLLPLAIKLPYPAHSELYSLFNPFYGDERERAHYLQDKRLNLEAIKGISPKKYRGILLFITHVDNSAILPNLTQKTLIISCNKDPLMPVSEGEKLHRLIKNNKFIKTDRGHFEASNGYEIKEVNSFLK